MTRKRTLIQPPVQRPTVTTYHRPAVDLRPLALMVVALAAMAAVIYCMSVGWSAQTFFVGIVVVVVVSLIDLKIG